MLQLFLLTKRLFFILQKHRNVSSFENGNFKNHFEDLKTKLYINIRYKFYSVSIEFKPVLETIMAAGINEDHKTLLQVDK